MARFYLCPIIGSGTSHLDGRRPKYFPTRGGPVWNMMDYGLEPFCIIRANVTDQEHADLILNLDLFPFPTDLASKPDNLQVDTIQSVLSGMSIPDDWVTSNLTFRQILKGIAMIFQLAQRFHGLGAGRIFGTGRSLDTTFSQLPTSAKQKLKDAADSFGWDTSSLTASSTLRVLIRTLAHQWKDDIHMGGETL